MCVDNCIDLCGAMDMSLYLFKYKANITIILK